MTLHTIWRAFLTFMAGIDGAEYRATIPQTTTQKAQDYWQKHLRNDQVTYNEFEARRYAQGFSSVSNVTQK